MRLHKDLVASLCTHSFDACESSGGESCGVVSVKKDDAIHRQTAHAPNLLII